MTGIELWSTTAASNNSAPPNGSPEGCAPSSINDTIRQCMAATREWYENAEWINLGHTPTYIGATQFSVTGDKRTTYQVGRRVKAYGTTPFTIYGTISVSAYSSVTTVTVVWDSGSLNSTLTTIWVGAVSVTNKSVDASAINGLTAAITAAAPSAPFIDSTAIIKGSADATKLLKIEVDGFTTGTTRTLTAPNSDGTIAILSGGNYTGAINFAAAVDVAASGTADIGAAASNTVRLTGGGVTTSLGTVAAGIIRDCYYVGATTLTHNATSLIIPGGANITTAANDRFRALSLGSGNWLILSYTRASGLPVATPTTTQFLPSDPTGTTSATQVMMGIGGTVSFTPSFSGKVKITFECDIEVSSGGADLGTRLRYGTGTAPTNGAALTGTTIGRASLISPPNGGDPMNQNLTAVVSGLTVSTAYWFDVSLGTTGGTAAMKNICVIIEEI